MFFDTTSLKEICRSDIREEKYSKVGYQGNSLSLCIFKRKKKNEIQQIMMLDLVAEKGSWI